MKRTSEGKKKKASKQFLGLEYRVEEFFEALHGEEPAHGHAVVDEQLDKRHAVHDQGVQHGLLKGVSLSTKEGRVRVESLGNTEGQVRVDWSSTIIAIAS